MNDSLTPRVLLLAAALGLGAFATPGICATTPANAPAPRAQFSELIFDFGKVMPNERPRHDFVVTNTGRAPLLITAVEPSCGCTTAGEWDREIAPGKTGRIPLQFNPENFQGKVAKAVAIVCNDPEQPRPMLELHAVVWRPFDVQPAFVSFLPVEGEPGAETKIVRIVNNLEGSAALELVPSTNPRFTTSLVPVRPDREFELRVVYDSGVAAGDINTAITVKTGHPDQPLLTVTAFAMPQPAVTAVPTAIQLPAGRLDASYSFNLVVRSNSRTALRVFDPATNIPGAVVRLSEGEPGKLYYVNLSCPQGFAAPADAPAVLTVKTSHPKFAEIRVPVAQEVPAAAGAR